MKTSPPHHGSKGARKQARAIYPDPHSKALFIAVISAHRDSLELSKRLDLEPIVVGTGTPRSYDDLEPAAVDPDAVKLEPLRLDKFGNPVV